MSAVVIPFASSQPRQRSQGWRPDEIAEVYRVVDLLGRAGVAVSIDSGRTDEGEPWLAVLRDDTEDVVVHVARIDGRVIVASTASERVFSGPSLSETLRRVVGTEILILPKGGGASLYLHPAALLAAVIATALTQATAGDTTGTDSIAQGRSDASTADGTPVSQSGTGPQPRDDLRSPASVDSLPLPGRQDVPAYPQSVVATAVATVVLSVTLTGEEQFAQVEREFLEALRATLPAGTPAQPPEDRHGAADHAQADAASAIPLEGELSPASVAAGETPLHLAPTEGPVGVGEVGAAPLRAELPHWPDLGLPTAGPQHALLYDGTSGADRPWVSDAQTAGDGFRAHEAAEGAALTYRDGTGGAAGLSGHPAAVHAPPAALRAVPASSHDAEASPTLDQASTLVEFSHLYFFRSGIEALGVFKFDDLLRPEVADVDEDGTPPHMQGSGGLGTAVSPTLHAGPEGLRPGGAPIPYEASAEAKALALSDFAYGSEHEVDATPEVLQSVRGRVASNSFLEGVDRVIVFDAPSANADIFMLMPGVAMIRSNLTYDVVQPLAAPPVEFALSDGSTLRLLGMIDI
jgi:hypothetical protein